MRWSLATIALVPRGQTAHAERDERQRVFQWAANAGFEGVEISPHWLDLARLGESELKQVRDDARVEGLVVSGVNINRCILTRSDRVAEHLDLLHRAVDATHWMGTGLVTLSLSLPLGGATRGVVRGIEFSEEERGEAAEQLRRLADCSASRDVRLSLELHDDGMLDTADLCLDMLSRVRADNVGVNPDLGNLVRGESNADWRGALLALAPHANNWHAKNYRGGQPSPVWDGEIDYVNALEIMRALGYGGWVSIESYFGNVLDLQTKSLAYLKQIAAADNSLNQQQGSAA